MEAGLCCSLWKPWGKKSLIHVIHRIRALQGRFPQGGTVRRRSVLPGRASFSTGSCTTAHRPARMLSTHRTWPEWCFTLPGLGSCLGQRVGTEQLLLLTKDQGRVLWEAVTHRALLNWDSPHQKLPEHTAAHHHVTSWLALSLCLCLRAVMAWDSGRFISPKLAAGFASL